MCAPAVPPTRGAGAGSEVRCRGYVAKPLREWEAGRACREAPGESSRPSPAGLREARRQAHDRRSGEECSAGWGRGVGGRSDVILIRRESRGRGVGMRRPDALILPASRGIVIGRHSRDERLGHE